MQPPLQQSSSKRFGYVIAAYITFMASAFVLIHLLHPPPVLRYIRMVTGNKMLNTSMLGVLPPDDNSGSGTGGGPPLSASLATPPPAPSSHSLLSPRGNKKNLVDVVPNPIPKDKFERIERYFFNRLPAKIRMMCPWMVVMDYPFSYFITNVLGLKWVPFVDANLISFIHPLFGFLSVYFLLTSVKEIPPTVVPSSPMSKNGGNNTTMMVDDEMMDDENNNNNNNNNKISSSTSNNRVVDTAGGGGGDIITATENNRPSSPVASFTQNNAAGGVIITTSPASPAVVSTNNNNSHARQHSRQHSRHHSRGASDLGSVVLASSSSSVTMLGGEMVELKHLDGTLNSKSTTTTTSSGLSKRKLVGSVPDVAAATVSGSPLTITPQGAGGSLVSASASPTGMVGSVTRSFSMEDDGGAANNNNNNSNTNLQTGGDGNGSNNNAGLNVSGGSNNSGGDGGGSNGGGGGDGKNKNNQHDDTAKDSHSLLYTDDGTRFTQDAWRLRLAGLCLLTRNFLDTFDGVMARSQSEAGIQKKGWLKNADGHVIDATMDTIGSTVVFITIFVVLFRRRVLLSPVVSRFLAMCGLGFHKRKPLLVARIVAFLGPLGLLFVAPLWEAFVMRYTHLFDPNVIKYAADLVPIEQKLNVRFSLFLWSTVCGDSVLFLAFLAMFFDVLWEMAQYMCFVYIPCLGAIWLYAAIVWNESVLKNPIALQLWQNIVAAGGP